MDIKADKIEDLLSNEEFRDWVLKPDTANQAFWLEWMKSNPCKKKVVLAAKDIIYTLGQRNVNDKITNKEKEELLNRILNKY
ncbi:hypothetical protein [Flagellimonas sp.]|uniref:hypothetical protein n=1 Tax=Flagellimonas sp. TaxID=2058762 RepID=UPI003B5ABBE2